MIYMSGLSECHTMWKFVSGSVLLAMSVVAQADTCVVPVADSGEPYVTLATLRKDELRTLLNEYMFKHSWATHSEAVAAGFRYGDRVYGQILRTGGKFGANETAAWRRVYESSARARPLEQLRSKGRVASVDGPVVRWMLDACLGTRTWSRLKVIDECRFEFEAGLQTDGAQELSVHPLALRVSGGRCTAWPDRPLSTKGTHADCIRSGRRGGHRRVGDGYSRSGETNSSTARRA